MSRKTGSHVIQGAVMDNLLSTSLQVAPSTTLTAKDAFLRANSEIYEWLAEMAQRMDRPKKSEAMLSRVATAASFAAVFHPGRFADGTIENLALELGARPGEPVAEDGGLTLPVIRKESRRRVLHVASHVLGIGGHTRMLYHWVRNDQDSCHSLVLVRQRDLAIPQWLAETVRKSGGDLVVFPTASRLCQKAKWLRETARRNADLVVLHHDGSDVVPTIAFAVHDCPPVTVLNHADHQFWLGSSISDMVINLRTAGAEHTAARRFISSNTVIPVPLADSRGRVSRRDARQALGIPKDQLMLLSIGRGEKYRPCGSHDFVSTANKILVRQPGTHLYVVGESAAGIAPFLNYVVHDRLHFVGKAEDPSLYSAAADIFLESFPFGSQTALLEAALSGLPVVPAYAPLFPLLVANDDSVQDLLPNPKEEQEYVQRVEFLIQNPEQRVVQGDALRGRLLIDHVGQGWLDRLAGMYKETDRLTHCPRPIPASPCGMTDADISLSLWHVMAGSKTKFTSEDSVGAVLRHKAYVAKYVGDFATARRYAWRAIVADPYRRVSWRLFAVALLGRAGKFIRRCFDFVKVTLSIFSLLYIGPAQWPRALHNNQALPQCPRQAAELNANEMSCPPVLACDERYMMPRFTKAAVR
jgi:glycosyltransferase involved in cell wall biosynthesis